MESPGDLMELLECIPVMFTARMKLSQIDHPDVIYERRLYRGWSYDTIAYTANEPPGSGNQLAMCPVQPCCSDTHPLWILMRTPRLPVPHAYGYNGRYCNSEFLRQKILTWEPALALERTCQGMYFREIWISLIKASKNPRRGLGLHSEKRSSRVAEPWGLCPLGVSKPLKYAQLEVF